MTIAEELSTLREALKQHIKNVKSENWEDSFLYSVWKKCRAEAIGLDTKTNNRQVFCLELIDALSHECGCIPYGCKVKKSKYPLPSVIGGDSQLRLMTMGGQTIGYIENNELVSRSINPLMKGKRFYSLSNHYVIIWNDKELRAVQAYGPWEDPLQWLDIQYCDDNDGLGDCVDLDTIDAGITEEQSSTAMDLAIRKLVPLLNMNKDEEADSYTEK